MNRCQRCGTWRRTLKGGVCAPGQKDTCGRRSRERSPITAWVRRRTKRFQPGYRPSPDQTLGQVD